MSDEEKKQKAGIEALLFATNGFTIEEIVKRTGIDRHRVKQILEEFELEHMQEAKGIHIVQDGDIWKMSVKPEMTLHVKDLLPPELPKALTQTLAVIAAKKPVRQSIIVKIRGNKAYGHVSKLLKLGFITAEKFGSTKVLDLTEKFFRYFQLKEADLKEKFKLDAGIEKAIAEAEKEVEAEEKQESVKKTN
jgi:segregation and condensation protein B